MDIDRICFKCLKPSLVGGRCKNCGSPKEFFQEPPYALPVKTILHGRYLTGAVLGFGGYGITYGGIDLVEERRVAIKEFMPDGQAYRRPGTAAVVAKRDPAVFEYGVKRFIGEARAIFRYRGNSHIVAVYQLFRENNTAYYVMEYLDGKDLMHLIREKGGRVEYNLLLPVILPVMEALSDVHREHMVHRDVSPDNIFLTAEGGVKLIDFGAARTAWAGRSQNLSIILKRGFAPEEQYRSRGKQGPWTDVYALAGTVYFALTGVMPQEAPDRLKEDRLTDLREFGVEIPDYAKDALMKALSVRAAERFSTMEEFEAALLGTQGEKSAPSRRMALYGIAGIYRGSSFPIGENVVFGRNPAACQLIFPETARGVSGLQCQISISADRRTAVLSDLNSTYGTWLNGRKLSCGGQAILRDGDRISFGEDQMFEIVL